MANISHFTQTVNGVSTTYDIHDANAVPRSGGAVITGTTIGRTDNTKGLDICGGTSFENGGFVVLRGKDADVPGQEGAVVIGTNNGSNNCYMLLKPDGTATWGNKEIETIEEQGEGYIRYSSGIQICWGNGAYDNGQVISYPKVFREIPSCVTSSTTNATDWGEANFTMTVYSGRSYACWLAIGHWK